MKFKVIREMMFSNYFMNEDTIALAIDDDADGDGELFLDTGANPLSFRRKKHIDR